MLFKIAYTIENKERINEKHMMTECTVYSLDWTLEQKRVSSRKGEI